MIRLRNQETESMPPPNHLSDLATIVTDLESMGRWVD